MQAIKFNFPEPTNTAKALAKIEECKEIARKNGLELPEDIGCSFQVLFNVNSIRTAGFASYKYFEQEMTIRLHPKALEYYGDRYIDQTVVHEFAHIMQYVNYPESKSHGREFKMLMMLFGASTDRCHTYDLEKVTGKKRRKVKRVSYKCSCRVHNITKNRIAKINKGAKYYCVHCKEYIKKA